MSKPVTSAKTRAILAEDKRRNGTRARENAIRYAVLDYAYRIDYAKQSAASVLADASIYEAFLLAGRDFSDRALALEHAFRLKRGTAEQAINDAKAFLRYVAGGGGAK